MAGTMLIRVDDANNHWEYHKMKRREAFKNKLTTFGLHCLSFFLIIVGLVFTIQWFMWAFYMTFLMFAGMMFMGLGGFILFYLYMNKLTYYNKST